MRKLKYLFLALVLVCALSLQTNRAAFGWSSTGGDGTDYLALQEVAVFFNNSGGTLSAGDVVILDTSGSGVTAGTTLGAYVTTTSSADSVLVMGVVKSNSVADQRPIAVVTKGPVDTFCNDANDAVTVDTAVGTTTILAGKCGGGTNLGIALEAGSGTDVDKLIVWVAPTGGD